MASAYRRHIIYPVSRSARRMTGAMACEHPCVEVMATMTMPCEHPCVEVMATMTMPAVRYSTAAGDAHAQGQR